MEYIEIVESGNKCKLMSRGDHRNVTDYMWNERILLVNALADEGWRVVGYSEGSYVLER